MLEYLGITSDRVGPLAILAVLAILFMNKKINPLYALNRRISNAIIEIQAHFRRDGIHLDHTLTEAPGSPLQPTEYGADLIKQSGLEKVLTKNKDTLLEKLKNGLPTDYTEYDVQEQARETLLELKHDALIRPLKEFAYNEGIDIETILRTGGLWLRDDFLGNKRKTSPAPTERDE